MSFKLLNLANSFSLLGVASRLSLLEKQETFGILVLMISGIAQHPSSLSSPSSFAFSGFLLIKRRNENENDNYDITVA